MEIKITKGDGVYDNTFTVECGDKIATELGYDEMLGLVSSLSMISLDSLPCMGFLKKKQVLYHPKDGDFVSWGLGNVSIYRRPDPDKDGWFKSYASLYGDNLYVAVSDKIPDDFRPATEEEKLRLLLALADGGRFWVERDKRLYETDEFFNLIPV